MQPASYILFARLARAFLGSQPKDIITPLRPYHAVVARKRLPHSFAGRRKVTCFHGDIKIAAIMNETLLLLRHSVNAADAIATVEALHYFAHAMPLSPRMITAPSL